MPGIAFAPTSYDLQGGVRLSAEQLGASSLRGASRRISRTATLDGGADVTDTGWSAADQTITVVVPNVSKAVYDRCQAIVQTSATVTLITEDGAFLASPQRLTLARGEMRLTFLIQATA